MLRSITAHPWKSEGAVRPSRPPTDWGDQLVELANERSEARSDVL